MPDVTELMELIAQRQAEVSSRFDDYSVLLRTWEAMLRAIGVEVEASCIDSEVHRGFNFFYGMTGDGYRLYARHRPDDEQIRISELRPEIRMLFVSSMHRLLTDICEIQRQQLIIGDARDNRRPAH